MPEIRSNPLSFDRGIESITHASKAQGSGVGSMPERANAPPADLNNRPQLDRLLHQPSMDDMLDEGMRPVLENRDLLSPSRFRETLGQVLTNLRDSGDKYLQRGDTPSMEQARSLNRAARLLQEESQLRELLQTYRSALYQG